MRVPEDLQPLLSGVPAEQPVAGIQESLRVDGPRQHQQRRDQKGADYLRRQGLSRREVQSGKNGSQRQPYEGK